MRNQAVTAAMVSFLFLFSLAFAVDAPKLAFGSMQSGERGSAIPGGNVTYDIYFFVDSEYGNRITHVTLKVSDAPDGWNVTINPEVHQSIISISGVQKTITESLYVEPKPLLNASEIPSPKPEGAYYLSSPSGKGYLQAKMAQVTIYIPADAKIGDTYTITTAAIASWYGDQGVVLFNQARDFTYKLSIASPGGFTEEIIATNISMIANTTKNETSTQQTAPDQTMLYVLGGLVIVAVVYVVFLKKK